jgi:hypothetical protein
VLSLVGVAPADIAADYALSRECEPALSTARGIDDANPVIDAFLRAEGTTAEEALLDFLHGLDLEARLRVAGLADADLDALRTRILAPAPA